MNWTAPIELSGHVPTPDPDQFEEIPRLVLLYAAPETATDRCPICGGEAIRVVYSPVSGRPLAACMDPPPEEILAALRGWCRSLGLNEAAAVLRRLARRPFHQTPEDLAPLILLEAGETLDDMGARPRRSLADLVQVIRASGPALAERMPRDEWMRFQERLLDNLWP
jgi:hypothetical protein